MLLDYTLAVHQARQRNEQIARQAAAYSRFEETGRRRRRRKRPS